MYALNHQQTEAYLHHLDTAAPQQPDLANLDRLIVAHQRRVAFENVDVLLDCPIHIDADSVFTKVVERQRGGYCYELNNLFARLLLALGYQVELLGGRVRWGLPLDAPQTMLSHLMLRVQLPEGPHLADVGFGSATPWRAVPLEGPMLPDFPYRLRPQDDDTGEVQLENFRAETGWAACYRFGPDVHAWVDCIPRNWYTSTHPNSVFRQMLMTARSEGEWRLTLANGTFNKRHRDGRVESRKIEHAAELVDVLQNDFLLNLTDDEIEPLRQRLESLLNG
ncbi:arylamine N-acetyltransferase family protein [Pseudomonas sp. TCU-HL1]|uniref:arylamine N-acetyltransferase family protein n=1 Tax=Pseudomonas sp. TCU-HL1 TaxID=1856685 RepID=UPI00083D86E7|nr:arylamine N-acetyltransferase [Pseudomonas sp. TCU-HL1]AOE87566.1 arylamine N-acetyltransferase [Pseudomonas sp. TCU-HL1]